MIRANTMMINIPLGLCWLPTVEIYCGTEVSISIEDQLDIPMSVSKRLNGSEHIALEAITNDLEELFVAISCKPEKILSLKRSSLGDVVSCLIA